MGGGGVDEVICGIGVSDEFCDYGWIRFCVGNSEAGTYYAAHHIMEKAVCLDGEDELIIGFMHFKGIDCAAVMIKVGIKFGKGSEIVFTEKFGQAV